MNVKGIINKAGIVSIILIDVDEASGNASVISPIAGVTAAPAIVVNSETDRIVTFSKFKGLPPLKQGSSD